MIATDIDRTVLPVGGTISEASRRAVRACRARGIPFIIASGRWVGALGDIIRALEADDMPIIIANGSAVLRSDGVPMKEWPLDAAQARRVYDVLRGFDVQINSYVRDGLYCLNTQAIKRRSTMITAYIGGQGHKLVVDDVEAFEKEALDYCYKLEALTEDRALIHAVEDALSGFGLAVTHSSERNVEIMSPGVGKGAALRWLAGELGITMEQCMAFGDNANDLDMLSVVGWPVAVANATDEVKAIARIIAPADVDDGVATVVFREVLGEPL